jgi:magnesium chelatase family protein
VIVVGIGSRDLEVHMLARAQTFAIDRAREAMLIEGIDVAVAERLTSAVRVLEGGEVAEGLRYDRPFRAPHHSATTAGLIGGAKSGWVGEVVLAYHGVLFLDELAEFAPPTLEALRQPMVLEARERQTTQSMSRPVTWRKRCRCEPAGLWGNALLREESGAA